jgi:3-oxoacyl-[acyl-carrier-protein] synthase II
MRRVVVTGIGAITPIGKNITESWANLIASKSGISTIPDGSFKTDDLATKIAGTVLVDSDYDAFLSTYISSKEARKMDRFIQFSIVAAAQAVTDAGGLSNIDPTRIGVMAGSGIGGLACIEENVNTMAEKGARRVSPFFIPGTLINLAAGHISMMYGFMGPNQAVVTACATGGHAIGDAARVIRDNDADIMVAGGGEAAICRIGIAGFNACRALSTAFNDSPQKASRPWDKDRDGFVMGEGAGYLILEEFEHAKSRGAKIYCELAGYGSSGDAYHITSPSPEGRGAILSMEMALRRAGINRSEIGYINAHGTSTPVGDMIEITALRKVFADDVAGVSISSTKSSIGHLLGAAGGVEAIFSILALKYGILPPTLNLDNPEEGCNGLDLVPHIAREKKLKAVMSNSFGFGGTNSSLIFKVINA